MTNTLFIVFTRPGGRTPDAMLDLSGPGGKAA